MLYAVCSVLAIHYTLYRMHYKFIVEVLEKIMRRMEMIDHLPGLYTFKTRLTADFVQIWIFEKQVPGLPET